MFYFMVTEAEHFQLRKIQNQMSLEISRPLRFWSYPDSHIPELFLKLCISHRYVQRLERNWKNVVCIKVENLAYLANFQASRHSALIRKLKLSKHEYIFCVGSVMHKKLKYSIKGFFSKFDPIHNFLCSSEKKLPILDNFMPSTILVIAKHFFIL